MVVLTTSDADQDIVKSYDLQANCYVTKPVDFAQFTKVVHSIKDFSICALVSKASGRFGKSNGDSMEKDFWLCVVAYPGNQ